ncbi:unnamed protein product [Cuscuta campestris]|uniref:Uncharacterized protein n=1 Tax=Cuscuta campestris TaxID=132261 RepID=A0A484KBZ8_9ASTE|nr:unnamed protein product [Cuscuta campestris]
MHCPFHPVAVAQSTWPVAIRQSLSRSPAELATRAEPIGRAEFMGRAEKILHVADGSRMTCLLGPSSIISPPLFGFRCSQRWDTGEYGHFFRRSAFERGDEGSVTGSAQESDSRSASVEEIVEAVEIPLQSEPRNLRRTALEDSGIRARKCTITAEEFRKAKRLASAPGVTVRRPTPEQSVFDALSGFFVVHLKSLEVRPNLARFLLLFRLAKSSGRANSDSGSYASIFQRQERLFKTRKDSAKSWKGKFIFISLSSDSPFRKEPLSSFRRRSACVTSNKMLEDIETLCQGGPFEVGSVVTNEALAELGFVFLSPEDTQRSIEEGPSGEIMLSSAERMKLMFPDAPSGNSQAPPSGGRPPTPPVKPTPETTLKKKRKETASAADALQGSESPMMKDFGHPKYVKAAFPARVSFLDRDYNPETFLRSFTPPTDRAKIKDIDRETLASDAFHELGSAMMRMAAKEQALQAEERVQQLAEEAARKARQEARDQAVAEFLASDAFQEEAFTRMNDLLKAWGQTPEGKAFARSEGTSWYNLGLFRAQQVLSDRPSLTPPPSLRDSWDSDSEFESVHPDPSAKIPGFIYYSSEEDERTPSPSAPPVRREVVAPPVPVARGGRGRRPPAPPAAIPSESSVASHHPSRCSPQDPGSPSYDESIGHSVTSRAPSPSQPPPCLCERGWNCGMH